ncbi:LemA family protein [Desulfovibrio litoralis]|uniref:LemA protein n=1 Tax=Desulfovibrio litoralis DSM 11393 TaxID=1121455 RepID=A0A1M7TLB2_9BACT|nr:LemA family protein [Desulfovibrio litoralis]SHN71529.1 LemA protein [Desulfovibrio litoralis DSM 11393]
MYITLILLISLPIILVLLAIYIYNSMIRKDRLAKEAWHGIDVQLKRRYDLIPNLVETVKGYAKHESGTLEEVIKLRNSISMNTPIDGQLQKQNLLSGMLKSVFALAENYPDLKANTNFIELQNSLNDIEDNLQDARRYYNATVRDFNTFISIFPNNLLAQKFKFEEKDFFMLEDDSEKQTPKITF